ncbi:MAG TPA: WcaI family glycosyltransferase [Opitutus sp.]|nr:WcaI family glycosyltransferase [Opitutus sp.]
MKIILWGINYRPEPTGIAPYNAELAEFLASRHHDVRVVTGFAYYPHWRKERPDRFRFSRAENIDGVAVFRCWQYVPRRVTTLRRIFHELSFGVSSLVRVLLLPRADVYVVVSPPLCLGFFAWIASRLKRSCHVFHVQDLQPGAAVGLGMVKNRGFIRALAALERFSYRHAAAVSGISDGMMEEFRRKRVDSRRRVHFPNWLRRSAPAAERSGRMRERLNVPATNLLAVYSGNLGRKQGIDVLLEAAQRLRDVGAAVTMVIAGAGAEREALAARIAELRLPELKLLPLLSDADYAALLADADVGLITQAPGTGRYFFPSKLLTLLQAGLPVVTVADADSELARAVADGGFGINLRPGRPGELATALQSLGAAPHERARLRERTRWVQRFSPTLVLPTFAHQLERIVLESGNPSPAVTAQPEAFRY